MFSSQPAAGRGAADKGHGKRPAAAAKPAAKPAATAAEPLPKTSVAAAAAPAIGSYGDRFPVVFEGANDPPFRYSSKKLQVQVLTHPDAIAWLFNRVGDDSTAPTALHVDDPRAEGSTTVSVQVGVHGMLCPDTGVCTALVLVVGHRALVFKRGTYRDMEDHLCRLLTGWYPLPLPEAYQVLLESPGPRASLIPVFVGLGSGGADAGLVLSRADLAYVVAAVRAPLPSARAELRLPPRPAGLFELDAARVAHLRIAVRLSAIELESSQVEADRLRGNWVASNTSPWIITALKVAWGASCGMFCVAYSSSKGVPASCSTPDPPVDTDVWRAFVARKILDAAAAVTVRTREKPAAVTMQALMDVFTGTDRPPGVSTKHLVLHCGFPVADNTTLVAVPYYLEADVRDAYEPRKAQAPAADATQAPALVPPQASPRSGATTAAATPAPAVSGTPPQPPRPGGVVPGPTGMQAWLMAAISAVSRRNRGPRPTLVAVSDVDEQLRYYLKRPVTLPPAALLHALKMHGFMIEHRDGAPYVVLPTA